MSTRLLQVGLLALAAWCLADRSSSAQTPVQTQPPPSAYAPVSPVSASEVVVENGQPAPRSGLQACFNKHGMGCDVPPNSNGMYFGCGNFWWECHFIFGSCRDFFGQPCTPNPGHYGAGADGGRKCCGN